MATRDENRFRTLKASLADLGPFRRGTVLRRFVPSKKPGDPRQADPPKLHGPYYDWTRKVKGKTVTVRVTPEQARLLKLWIANSRQLDKTVADLHRVSDRITEPLFQAARRPPKGS